MPNGIDWAALESFAGPSFFVGAAANGFRVDVVFKTAEEEVPQAFDDGAPNTLEVVVALVSEGIPNGFDVVLGLSNGFPVVSSVEDTPNVLDKELGFPNGFVVASGLGGAVKGLCVEVGLPNAVVALDLRGAPKGLRAGAGEPNGEGFIGDVCANESVAPGEGALLKGPDFCSVVASAKRTCLWVYRPRSPLPAPPLTIIPF